MRNYTWKKFLADLLILGLTTFSLMILAWLTVIFLLLRTFSFR
jgi:hypothetical protein